MGTEQVDLIVEGPLVVDLVIDSPEIAVVEPRKPTVVTGKSVATVLVAAVDPQGKSVVDLQDNIGFAFIVTRGVDEIDGAEGIVIEPGEISEEQGRIDRALGFETDLSGETFGFKKTSSFGADFSEMSPRPPRVARRQR
jgi:hypothetical protein